MASRRRIMARVGNRPTMRTNVNAIPPQASVWDRRRNTSQVQPVPSDSWRQAVAALERWAAENPGHARWIADGYPSMSEAEHRDRFGEPYRKTPRRRK